MGAQAQVPLVLTMKEGEGGGGGGVVHRQCVAGVTMWTKTACVSAGGKPERRVPRAQPFTLHHSDSSMSLSCSSRPAANAHDECFPS